MKVVISGAASCGKTSLINELSTRGFNVFGDAARKILTERKNHLALRSEIEFRQNKIFDIQESREKQHPPEEIIFFDYSLVDVISYTQHLLKKKINFPKDISSRYDAVFLLDRLPWIKDNIRVESNDQEAKKIQKLIEDNYKMCGCTPISVPVLPVKERAIFILEKLGLTSLR